ncbi:MAG: formate dehydrogenase accessory sulfurtransferase FdhD, partial [Actinomycetota bacterium]
MGEDERPGSRVPATVTVADGGRTTTRLDYLATEEPLELRIHRLGQPGPARSLAVTMRTPGADFELAAGFLFGEGLITDANQVHRICYCEDVDREDQRYNVVTVDLTADAPPEEDLAPLDRHFTTTSACGVCGKASLEALEVRGCLPLTQEGPQVELATIYRLPGTLSKAQKVFRSTGGLHAAGLFDPGGNLLALREDVGRHNA